MRRRWLLGIALVPILIGVLHQQLGIINHKDTPSPPPPTAAPSCDRIVSLAPSMTESLFAVGLGDHVVGVTRYCAFPEVVAGIEKVGGYVDPNLSAIVALDPTLVVMLEEHVETREKLDALGIRTLSVSQHGVDNILGTMDRLGELCRVTAQSHRVIADLRKRLARIKEAVRDRPQNTVMISMGRNMGGGGLKDAFIAGEESYYQDLIDMAGGRNVYKGRVPFPIVSREGILGLNPDVIIDMVPDMKAKGWTEEMVRREWQALPVSAVRHNRVHVFMAAHNVVPGPRFILTLEEMARAIHPEIEWNHL